MIEEKQSDKKNTGDERKKERKTRKQESTRKKRKTLDEEKGDTGRPIKKFRASDG